MKFLYLCDTELEGVKVKWSESHSKSPELVDAALAAGFTSQEIEHSPVGVLEEGYQVSPTEIASAGAVVLTGTNGSMLLEMPG